MADEEVITNSTSMTLIEPNDQTKLNNRLMGCFMGLVVGDALGGPVEFALRDTFSTVTGMSAGGKHRLTAGQWTDDTSMACCLADSLIRCQGYDPLDVMQTWQRWWREGYWSSKPRAFGVGQTIFMALARFGKTNDPYAGVDLPNGASNGALMRLAPLAIYYHDDAQLMRELMIDSTRLTHGHPEVITASGYFAHVISGAIQGKAKEQLLTIPYDSKDSDALKAIAQGAYRHKTRDQIESTGYVVHSLEASLWAFEQTTNFKDALLLAVNLGGDADTIAAITGQIAGAYYGLSEIPNEWLSELHDGDALKALCEKLGEAKK